VRVAVLGAGIMGCSTALLLARRPGVTVTLFDEAPTPFSGASRWNEGKIHLGYLYAADGTTATARKLLPGGLAFGAITEELIGHPLDDVVTAEDDVYVVHRSSVVDGDASRRYFDAVSDLVRHHPDAAHYLADASGARAFCLTQRELAADFDTALVVAGFRVPERSISTSWIADRFVEAIAASSIEVALGTRVVGVRDSDGAASDRLLVETTDGVAGSFDYVVNALWHGRLRVDSTYGLPTPGTYSHRYRVSVFVSTRSPVNVPSTVVATGPFGDVKNYTGRDLYLSWYPVGLLAEAEGIDPPSIGDLDAVRCADIAAATFRGVGDVVTSVAAIEAQAERVHVGGGWVAAAGTGSLADPASTLHRRQDVGIFRRGRYISVDTGKYSIAPWLAAQVVRELCP
jgi:hypothetical protein